MNGKTVHISFTINGGEKTLEIPAGSTALQVIRDHLGLKGTKEGCGIGECGACTVVVDGKAVNACLMPGPRLNGKTVLTVEGLVESGKLSVLQEAFLEQHAVQCGFCTPGILMSTHALLNENPAPGRPEIARAISGNLCRCTGYTQIVSAIEEAAGRMSGRNKT